MRTTSGVWVGLAVALLVPVAAATPTRGDSRADAQVSAVTSAQASAVTSATRAGEWRRVERVVDGDTLVLAGGEKVRLIGVDTPESVHPTKPVQRFGKEAAAFTRGLVLGKLVRLTYDWEPTDRYGRTLAYAHLRDGSVLNEVLIRRGYGRAYTWFRFAERDRYRALERGARAAKVGLWERPGRGSRRPGVRPASPAPSSARFVVTPSGSCYHRASCRRVSASATSPAVDLTGLRPCRVCEPARR